MLYYTKQKWLNVRIINVARLFDIDPYENKTELKHNSDVTKDLKNWSQCWWSHNVNVRQKAAVSMTTHNCTSRVAVVARGRGAFFFSLGIQLVASFASWRCIRADTHTRSTFVGGFVLDPAAVLSWNSWTLMMNQFNREEEPENLQVTSEDSNTNLY